MDDRLTAYAFAGSPISCCRVIDAHGHIGENTCGALVSTDLALLIAEMDRMGIDQMAVSALPAVFGDALGGNRLVEEAINRYPGRFLGYACINAGYPDTILPELERCRLAGFTGIKIWSSGARPGLPYDHPHYQPVFAYADTHALPILAHTWGAELQQLRPAIERYPNINWLMAHTGCHLLEEYIALGKRYPTVFLELCLSSCPRGLIEALVREGLAEKLIWGSDAIFMSAAQQLGRVLFARIPEEIKERILGLNAMRALRLSERTP